MDEPFLKQSHSHDDRSTTPRTSASNSSSSASFFYTSCLLLGVLVGFFVECTALAAHFLLVQEQQPYNNEVTASSFTWNRHMIVTSLIWAFLTSLMPCLVLVVLKSLLHNLLHLLLGKHGHHQELLRQSPDTSQQSTHHAHNYDSLLWQLECRFGIGSFCGVSLASLCVDGLLHHHGDWHGQVYTRIILMGLLLVTLVWLIGKTLRGSNKSAVARDGSIVAKTARVVAEVVEELRAPTTTAPGSSYKRIDDDADDEELQTVSVSLKKRRLDSVDPAVIETVEIKPGTLTLS